MAHSATLQISTLHLFAAEVPIRIHDETKTYHIGRSFEISRRDSPPTDDPHFADTYGEAGCRDSSRTYRIWEGHHFSRRWSARGAYLLLLCHQKQTNYWQC